MLSLHIQQFTTETDSTYLVTESSDGSGFVTKIGSNVYIPPDYTPVKQGTTFAFTSCERIEVGDFPHFYHEGRQVLQTSLVKRLDDSFARSDIDEQLIEAVGA